MKYNLTKLTETYPVDSSDKIDVALFNMTSSKVSFNKNTTMVDYLAKDNKGQYSVQPVYTLLETARGLLLNLKQKNNTSEISNAIRSIEESILYFDHYITRRTRFLEIINLPIPEDMNDTLRQLSDHTFTEITINFYQDKAYAAVCHHTETFKLPYATAVITPIVYGYITSFFGEAPYFIEKVEDKHITVGYKTPEGRINYFYPSDTHKDFFIFDFSLFNADTFKEVFDEIACYKPYDGNGVRLVNLFQFKNIDKEYKWDTEKLDNGVYIPQLEYDESSEADYSVLSDYLASYDQIIEVEIPFPETIDTNKQPIFVQQSLIDIAQELQKEHDLFVFSNPYHKNTLFYFGKDSNYTPSAGQAEVNTVIQLCYQNDLTNALVQSVNKVFERNMTRNFVNRP